ncbi:hypothetical protein D3C78_1043980 [compost metagenome]
MRIPAIHQRGVIGLSALNRAAQVVHQRFSHQVFREITPGLATVISTDPGENAEPGFIAFWLQIAEIPRRPNASGFDVDVAPIKLETFIIFQPVERSSAFFNLQRRTENRFIGHFGIIHLHRESAIFNAALKRSREVFCSGQQLPLLPGEIFPGCLESGLFRRLQGNIERQLINLPARLRGLPDIAQ